MVRSGTKMKNKFYFSLMLKFRKLLYDTFNQRGHKPLEKQKELVDKLIRTVTNVKNRQARAQGCWYGIGVKINDRRTIY